jgi:hypothetical protein
VLRKYTDGSPTIGVIGTECVLEVAPPSLPTPVPPIIVPSPPTPGDPPEAPPGGQLPYIVSIQNYMDTWGDCWSATIWSDSRVTNTPVAC